MTIKDCEALGFQCRCAYPEDMRGDKRYPVLFFLHGAGERGEDVTKLAANGPLKQIEDGREYPAVVIAPQLKEGTWFDKFESLQRLVAYFIELSFVDKSRVYLSGVSMGGYGSWQLLMSMPNTFAAAMICCGGGMSWNAPSIAHIPIWAFHGALDDVVPVSATIQMVNALWLKGSKAKLTVYENTWHDCWVKAFADDKVYEWLFQQRKDKEVSL